MATTLSITNKLRVTPLFDIQDAAFADTYRNGVWWSLYGECEGEKPLPDSYLVENLKRDASKGMFSSQQDDMLYHLGFYFGMVHGGILMPSSGQLRSDVTALVTLTHPNTKHGYSVARRDHFYYADVTYIRTESALLKELSEIVFDLLSYPDDSDSWYYPIGCLLGGLSIPLFPETDQEWHQWEAEHRDLLAKMYHNTEPLPSLSVIEHTI
jgi:hypothetical protein